MSNRIFALLALAISLFGTQSWAGTCTNDSIEGVVSCTNTFSPTDTTGTYEFFGNGRLIVQFETVLTTFTLTATVNHTVDPLDPNEFPAGTVCVTYSGNGGQCDQYDFTGSAGGANGVPVKNTDYKGLITLTLSYLNSQPIHNPAFGHATGDNATAVYSEDILTSYSTEPSSDPTMGGTLPGLSSVAAFDEPLTENDTVCSLTVSPTNVASGQKPEAEITFKLFNNSSCSGTALRDKTARLSVSTTDSGGNGTFPALKNVEANKFHWDSKKGINEYDISTEGRADGRCTVNVFFSEFSP